MQSKLKSIFGNHHGLDERSINVLTKALENANLPGFDYLEFKQSLAALTQMNMDEAMAIKSAFATASTMGLTKEKLLIGLMAKHPFCDTLIPKHQQKQSALWRKK